MAVSNLRQKSTRHLANSEQYKQKLLRWSQQFDEVIWLDSNNNHSSYSSYDALLAVDAEKFLKTEVTTAFGELKDFQSKTQDWLFGYLTYDLKNAVEELRSDNFDGLNFPNLYFFQPKKLFLLKGTELQQLYLASYQGELASDWEAIKNTDLGNQNLHLNDCQDIKIKLRIHKDEYFSKLEKLLGHIYRGDIYEANFCQEFYSENTSIDPLCSFEKLNAISAAPFAAYLKLKDLYLMSASPERFIKKQGPSIISQPIKGTAKRSKNLEEDRRLKQELSEDPKERSENIMIVDLVRNDLSKTAKKGTVNVAELCKVYTFEQVHQMISTVTAEVEADVHPVDILKSTFPMGSMTGAPKISAMEIIERLEETKRGLYSGAVGYITPEGDFDFNVVIRSILYSAARRYVSYSVGGAITAKSEPLKEYEECLIKAKAMREVLEGL